RLALSGPDEACTVLDDEGEAEGQQQAVERIPSIERPDQDALRHEADDRRERRRDQQRAPEPYIGRDRVGDVAADHQKSAMGKIDDVAQVENEREAQRHEHVEGTYDEAVRDVEEQELRHESESGEDCISISG